MNNILIISGDVIDKNMGGVGVRNWELAQSLSKQCNVTLAIPNPTELETHDFRLVSFDLEKGDLRDLTRDQNVIILHGFVLHYHPYLRELMIPLAVDLYVPALLEGLVWHDADDWEHWIPEYEEYARVQRELIRAGDFFFCASDRQRDYWLGWLHTLKRINPHTYRDDPTLRRLIDVVPFGIPEGEPKQEKAVLKGVHPGIAKNDRLILWSGGLWEWLDPLTLVRAMAILSPNHPNLKLYFMGTRHPNEVVSGMKMPERVIELSKELGLFGKTIFFGDWAPYDERENYLAEADLAVVSHREQIETHFSFRTRLLDCIWASIPIIITEGDEMSDLVMKEGLGISIPPANEAVMARAIERILAELDEHRFAANFERLKPGFRWQSTTEPLRKFCQNPFFAPDKGKYLTDVEKIAQDKDAFLEQVVHDKDAYFEKAMDETNKFWQSRVDERDAIIQRYQSSLPLRIYFAIKRRFRT